MFTRAGRDEQKADIATLLAEAGWGRGGFLFGPWGRRRVCRERLDAAEGARVGGGVQMLRAQCASKHTRRHPGSSRSGCSRCGGVQDASTKVHLSCVVNIEALSMTVSGLGDTVRSVEK